MTKQIPPRDADLSTEQEIRERIESVRRQRAVLNDQECRDNSITAFERKNAKIAKLTKREGALLLKLRLITEATGGAA